MQTGTSSGGKALTDLVLEIFRLNGRLLVAGDRLVAGLGLTSARWQVLGAIALAERPQPVSWLARSMGLNRQGVQRIVNEMKGEGLLEFEGNPHHRRAHLIVLSKKGQSTFAAASKLQAPWINRLAKGITVHEMEVARRVSVLVRERLEKEMNADAYDD
jgi:DNA-binding MarR family transcriptional regulator